MRSRRASFETDMSGFAKTDAGRDFALGMQALKRLAQPDDVGAVVAFLSSDKRAVDYRRYGPCGRRLEALSFGGV